MAMKLYRNLAEVIVKVLAETINAKKRSSRVLDREISKNKQWGARDRKLIRQATYDILRWKNQYEYLGASPENFWSYLKIWTQKEKLSLPNWDEFIALKIGSFPIPRGEFTNNNALKSGIPLWLDKKGKAQLSEIWEKECTALNTPASVVIRTNRILISPEKLQQLLQTNHNIETKKTPYYPDALILSNHYNLKNNPLYKKGYFEFQDANSQSIAAFCELKPNMDVLDACAGAGGKTLHLAAHMRNKGTIVAQDVHQGKLSELKKRVKRARVKNVKAILIEENQNSKNKTQWADRVLIDAPCSGVGTFKRNPELKWNLTETHLNDMILSQRETLSKYSTAVKPGGKLIYVTCSILPEENRKQVDWFLAQAQGKDFELEAEHTLFAHQTGFDGFYTARLKRKL